MCDLLVGHGGLHGVGGHQVRTVDHERLRLLVQVRNHGAYGELDPLRRSLSDLDVVLLAHVVLDVVVEHVSGSLHALLLHDASEGDHGDLRGTAAYVHHHVPFRRLHVKADTERGGHRFVDQVDFAASGMLAGIAHGADLHLGGSRRDSDHDLEVGGEEGPPLAVDLLDEALDHHLSRLEVGDDPVPEGPDGLYPGICVFMHQFRRLPDGDAFLGAVVDSHYARLVENDFVIVEYDGVRRAEVHCNFLSQKRKCHNLMSSLVLSVEQKPLYNL